jgi:hypothetical protein
MRLFAVIPTIGERNETLFPMISQLQADDVQVIVIHNERHGAGEWGSLDLSGFDIPIHYQHHAWLPDEPVNLSAIWNMGLDWAHELAGGEEYVVAVLNDDLVLPPEFVQQLESAVVHCETAASYAMPFCAPPVVHLEYSPLTLGARMVGYAFALRGSAGLRADEDFFWWWGDTDLDIRARRAGGVAGVWIPDLGHTDPNGYTNRRPELYEQAGQDRETFIRKYGSVPW